MKIRVLDLAVQDIERGRRFYDLQLPGLGVQFAKQLLADIEALLIHAGVHQQHFGYCRALSKRFPYAIYYRLDGDDIQVWRVLDCRANPSSLAEALN